MIIKQNPSSTYRFSQSFSRGTNDTSQDFFFFYLGFTARQDYFTHFEPSQSQGGAKIGDPWEKPPASRIWPKLKTVFGEALHDFEIISPKRGWGSLTTPALLSKWVSRSFCKKTLIDREGLEAHLLKHSLTGHWFLFLVNSQKEGKLCISL